MNIKKRIEKLGEKLKVYEGNDLAPRLASAIERAKQGLTERMGPEEARKTGHELRRKLWPWRYRNEKH